MVETGSKQGGNQGGRRPGSGRKPIGQQRSISIPDDLWQAAGEAAAAEGIKRPAWVRLAIAERALKQSRNTSETG